MLLTQRITDQLAKRKALSLYRARQTLQSPQQPHVILNGQPYLAFCSNDYLGLANHCDIVTAFKRAADEFGVGSGASHLVLGHSKYHHLLEERLAEKTGREKALLFSSGYMANVGVINGLLERGDAVFQDKLNHASLIDGAIISGANFKRYRHSDMSHLQQLLEKDRLEKTEKSVGLIVTDGVFSMDGDVAPLVDIATLAQRYDCALMVDDAHGFGVLGEAGQGSVSALGLSVKDVPIYMATLGKALGTAGAFVAGDTDLIEYLIQQARSYIYTTALPPAVAAATLASLDVLLKEPWRKTQLVALVQRFRQGAAQLGLQLMPSDTAIQPLHVGSAEQALKLSHLLREKNILVTAIRPPTVPENTARLRITLSAAHSFEDVDLLLAALAETVPPQGYGE